jgi:hypothetical protein
MTESYTPPEEVSGESMAAEKDASARYADFLLDLGISPDADGVVRLPSREQAEALTELAQEKGFTTTIREPRAEYPGMSDFARSINNLFAVTLQEEV